MTDLDLDDYFFIDTRLLRLLPEGGPIQQKARDILDSAIAFQEGVSSVGNKWQALGSVYQAPEQELVLRAMDQPVQQAANHLDSVHVFHGALDKFGNDLEEIARATADLGRATDTAHAAWVVRLDEMSAADASRFEMESARAEAIAPLQARLEEIAAQYEQSQRDCLITLGTIRRSSTNVVSSYSSSDMDLVGRAREDAIAAFDKATAPDASPEDIKAFYNLLLLAGPDLMNELGRRPGAAKFVAGMGAQEEVEFWTKLNSEQQEALLLALPGLVGNLEGAPYGTRDKANRKVLAILQAEFDDAFQNYGTTVTDYEFLVRKDALESLKAALDKDGRYLISLDPRTDAPLAAIAVGDVDTAANVSFLVPGMNSSSADAASMANQADALRNAQAVDGKHGEDTAVIAYMGYESPNMGTVSSENSAEGAAQTLATTLDGLHLTREAGGSSPEVYVVAHSYGTTLGSITLGLTDFPVTSAVFLASAGVPEGIAITDLNVDLNSDGQRNVFITTAEEDWLAPLGAGLGGRTNPSITTNAWQDWLIGRPDPWGGHQFYSDEVTAGNEDYEAVGSHDFSEYLGSDTFSLRIVALITSGRNQEAIELISAVQ